MKTNELIKKLNFNGVIRPDKDIEIKELFNGANRRIVEIKFLKNEIPSKHKTAEPITFFCLSGSGTFLAGDSLREKQHLTNGTPITLEAGIECEVSAEPEIHLLVMKFKRTS